MLPNCELHGGISRDWRHKATRREHVLGSTAACRFVQHVENSGANCSGIRRQARVKKTSIDQPIDLPPRQFPNHALGTRAQPGAVTAHPLGNVNGKVRLQGAG